MVNNVCKKIRLLRINKNFSQEYLASKLNISQSYYGRIENGKVNISLKCLFEILAILEIDYVDFFNEIKKNKKTAKVN